MDSGQEHDREARSVRVEALPPAKRALYEELRRRSAQAAGAAQFAEVAWLRQAGQGTGAQVVLAHPIGGSLFCYRELVSALPAALPVAGVAAGPALAGPCDVTIEDLARHDVTALARAGVTRPGVIAGWSFGGLLGYELARHWDLVTGGYRPPVVLIDAVLAPQQDAPWDDDTTVRTFIEYLLGLAGLSGPSDLGKALQAGRGGQPRTGQAPTGQALAGQALAEMAGRLRDQGVDLGLAPAELVRRYWMFANAGRAMRRYRPAGYQGQVVLMQTAQAAGEAVPWPAADEITALPLSGDHYGLLRPAVAAEIAEVIAAAIRT
jgi:thioesterase domain-containing protein